ncbi:MAG: DUF4252 domain-containing protein [Bacteroides sp.]|nr:DUF4252 domain-containing protein [Bacteroides sp.]
MLGYSISLAAQDFTSFFLEEYSQDSLLVHVTVGPKIMEEILQVEEPLTEEVYHLISNLKSMQMLTSDINAPFYYESALEVAHNNPERYETFLDFTGEAEKWRMMIRKKNDLIVELVMLMQENDRFTVINFTGTMDEEFIDKISYTLIPLPE